MSKLHNLKEASPFEVKKWLEEIIELTPYQKQKLTTETIRLSPFWFYERKKQVSSSLLWRMTLPIYCVYWVVLFIGVPFTFLITGRWGYGRKFIDNFHNKWIHKLGL